MLGAWIEIAELERGNPLLAGSSRDQWLLEYLRTSVSDRICRRKERFWRVGFPVIEMIEQSCIDTIVVADATDQQDKTFGPAKGLAIVRSSGAVPLYGICENGQPNLAANA